MISRPNPEQLIQHLQTNSFFTKLDSLTLRNLAEGALWREYAAGEAIFWEGEDATGLFYLHSGWIKVIKTAPNGREQVLRFLESGDMFNEVGAFSSQPNPATAVALEPVGIWLLKREAITQLLQQRPDFAQHVIENMAERVQHLVTLVADLSLRSFIGRLARRLLEDADGGTLHRPQWYTQTELAARLGTVPDVIQRAQGTLESDSIIDVQRHLIRIQDRPALTQIAT